MPSLLDLFCGAGGCSVGYRRAGFDRVVGVDLHPQPSYPYEFVRADALEYLAAHGHEFDAVHASPPCQRYTVAQHIHGSGGRHPDLVGPCREALVRLGRPWVIENVPGSPVGGGIVLCGLTFGLRVIRHRVFEASFALFAPDHLPHPKHLRTGTHSRDSKGPGSGYSDGRYGLVCVAGNNFPTQVGAAAMGIDWMARRREIANAIPPAYTEWVGRQLLRVVQEG